MCNATIKLLSAAILSAALSACGGPSEEQTAAQSLLDQAQQLSQQGQYDDATALLDSLCKAYPKQLDLVREAMHAKAVVLEKVFTAQLAQADSIIAEKMPIAEELGAKFKYVKTEDMVEGYKILASLERNPLVNRTGIEPRIDDGGNLYLFSLLHGVAAKHEKLGVSLKSDKTQRAETATVPYDDLRNYRFNDINDVSNETVTFYYDECADFCQFITDNASSNLNLTFSGKRDYTIALDKATKQAIADSYRYSTAIRDGLAAEKQKLLLQKKIEVAQSQIARTAPSGE